MSDIPGDQEKPRKNINCEVSIIEQPVCAHCQDVFVCTNVVLRVNPILLSSAAVIGNTIFEQDTLAVDVVTGELKKCSPRIATFVHNK
jgi:hypothetical protein